MRARSDIELFPSVICVFHNDDIENLEVSQWTFKLKATLCLFTETKTFCLSLLSFRKVIGKHTQTKPKHSRPLKGRAGGGGGGEAGSVGPAYRKTGSWKGTGLWKILVRYPSNPNMMRKRQQVTSSSNGWSFCLWVQHFGPDPFLLPFHSRRMKCHCWYNYFRSWI